MPRKKNPLGYRYCETCKIRFYSIAKGVRFCSYKCRGIAGRKGTISRYNVIEEIRQCHWCLQGFVCHINDPKKYCTRKCFEKSHVLRMAGENNPAYKDGSSYKKKGYRGAGWNEIRRHVYSRDKFTCRICLRKCVARSRAKPSETDLVIQCHHIRGYQSDADNTLDNLITLCLRCHTSVHQGAAVIPDLS